MKDSILQAFKQTHPAGFAKKFTQNTIVFQTENVPKMQVPNLKPRNLGSSLYFWNIFGPK
jgi:hypothetical protein